MPVLYWAATFTMRIGPGSSHRRWRFFPRRAWWLATAGHLLPYRRSPCFFLCRRVCAFRALQIACVVSLASHPVAGRSRVLRIRCFPYRLRPNHALQRTEAGGRAFLAFHILFRQPPSLSLEALGTQILPSLCQAAFSSVPMAHRFPLPDGKRVPVRFVGTSFLRSLCPHVRRAGTSFSSVHPFRRQRPSFPRRWVVGPRSAL